MVEDGQGYRGEHIDLGTQQTRRQHGPVQDDRCADRQCAYRGERGAYHHRAAGEAANYARQQSSGMVRGQNNRVGAVEKSVVDLDVVDGQPGAKLRGTIVEIGIGIVACDGLWIGGVIGLSAQSSSAGPGKREVASHEGRRM